VCVSASLYFLPVGKLVEPVDQLAAILTKLCMTLTEVNWQPQIFCGAEPVVAFGLFKQNEFYLK
jgi:hypothetical protein